MMPWLSDYDLWKTTPPWGNDPEREEDPFIEWANDEAERQENAADPIPCSECGGQGQESSLQCCGNWEPDQYGQAVCCQRPVMEITGWCAACNGNGWISYATEPCIKAPSDGHKSIGESNESGTPTHDPEPMQHATPQGR